MFKHDEVLFFHLSRRLNPDNDNHVGNNLFDLLTSENELSSFLKEHHIYFHAKNTHPELYYKNEFVSLEDVYKKGVLYLRNRLGYNAGREDFCFNGFAIKDLLYKNQYTKQLFYTPEFIGQLSIFLGQPDLVSEYSSKSKYYCLEYCVPINSVLFDDNDKVTNKEKSIYLLICVIKRLFEYTFGDKQYMFDSDNPVLRLKDYETMLERFYIGKEEITPEMIRNA